MSYHTCKTTAAWNQSMPPKTSCVVGSQSQH